MQKIYCPLCRNLIIKNYDLVIDDPIVMSLDRIKETDKEIKEITCHKCKRRIRYFVDSKENNTDKTATAK